MDSPALATKAPSCTDDGYAAAVADVVGLYAELCRPLSLSRRASVLCGIEFELRTAPHWANHAPMRQLLLCAVHRCAELMLWMGPEHTIKGCGPAATSSSIASSRTHTDRT